MGAVGAPSYVEAGLMWGCSFSLPLCPTPMSRIIVSVSLYHPVCYSCWGHWGSLQGEAGVMNALSPLSALVGGCWQCWWADVTSLASLNRRMGAH